MFKYFDKPGLINEIQLFLNVFLQMSQPITHSYAISANWTIKHITRFRGISSDILNDVIQPTQMISRESWEQTSNTVVTVLADGLASLKFTGYTGLAFDGMRIYVDTGLVLEGLTTSFMYRQVSNIRRTLEGNTIVDHSDVVGASLVVAAPTTSSFPT